jgi:hypothetical protein
VLGWQAVNAQAISVESLQAKSPVAWLAGLKAWQGMESKATGSSKVEE